MTAYNAASAAVRMQRCEQLCLPETQPFESGVTGAASLGAVEVVGVRGGVVEIDLAIGLVVLHAAGFGIRYSGVTTSQSSLFNPGIHVTCIIQFGEHSVKCQNQYMSS